MTPSRLLSAAAILVALALVPTLAQARTHHRHTYHHARAYALPYEISFLHNYGPGLTPGTFTYYDGPATNSCAQSAVAYLGQDRRRHPCN
jgi:hypothetical protein